MKLLFASLLVTGCGAVVDHHQPPPGTDAGGDAPPSERCDPAKPFGPATLVDNVNTPDDEIGFALANDEKLAFIDHLVQTPSLSVSLLVAQRASRTTAFSVPTIGPVSNIDITDGDEWGASATPDSLLLYFGRQVNPGDPMHVYVGMRSDPGVAFGDTSITLDGALIDGYAPAISRDGLTLYWVATSDARLRSAVRNGQPQAFTGQRVMSTIPVGNPVLSADELTLYYTDGAQTDILVSTRTSTAAPFGVGVPVANVNSSANDAPMYLSDDGCVLFLSSNRPGGVGGLDIWQAQRPR